MITQHLYYSVMEQVHCFDLLVMSVLAFWIYRVQRICDDIHFMQGSQPTKFWKILWYAMPIIVGVRNAFAKDFLIFAENFLCRFLILI